MPDQVDYMDQSRMSCDDRELYRSYGFCSLCLRTLIRVKDRLELLLPLDFCLAARTTAGSMSVGLSSTIEEERLDSRVDVPLDGLQDARSIGISLEEGGGGLAKRRG